jgi:carboxymethylenebutenolidase
VGGTQAILSQKEGVGKHWCAWYKVMYLKLYPISVSRHIDFRLGLGYPNSGLRRVGFCAAAGPGKGSIEKRRRKTTMDRIHVMELVRSFQIGELAKNEFVSKATVALGSVDLANLLVDASLSSPVEHPRPVVEARSGGVAAGAESGAGASGLAAKGPGWAEYPGPDGETLQGYLARPDRPGRRPAVIVIQEWWGLNDHIRDVTRRFAGEGFVALAPDLYHGVVVSEPDEARKAVMELDMSNAVREIQQAVRFLQGQGDVAGPKIGVVGFCMGGRLVLQTARIERDLGAAVSFYGTPLAAKDAAEVMAPILGLYGTEDASNPIDKVRVMEQALDKAGIENQIKIYDGAQHAFFNDTRASYHPEAAADAWKRTLAWLRAHLGGAE